MRSILPSAANADLQADLEDQILKMLSSATGSLLDNIELINALDASKATFETVTQSLTVSSVADIQLAPACKTAKRFGYRLLLSADQILSAWKPCLMLLPARSQQQLSYFPLDSSFSQRSLPENVPNTWTCAGG